MRGDARGGHSSRVGSSEYLSSPSSPTTPLPAAFVTLTLLSLTLDGCQSTGAGDWKWRDRLKIISCASLFLNLPSSPRSHLIDQPFTCTPESPKRRLSIVLRSPSCTICRSPRRSSSLTCVIFLSIKATLPPQLTRSPVFEPYFLQGGGGTCDLATYKLLGSLSSLEIAEVCARSGSSCGSLFLDLRFRSLVTHLLTNHPAHLDGASLANFLHAFSEGDKLLFKGGEADDRTIWRFGCFNQEDDTDLECGLVSSSAYFLN